MLKVGDKEVDAEEFALEYVRHDVLCNYKGRRDKYKCVVAYKALAQRFNLTASQARVCESRFRDYAYYKMETFVEMGLRDVDELPHELHWMRLVEDKFKLLPTVLKNCGIRRVEGASPACVMRALCAGAALRGTVDRPDLYDTVQHVLRLGADLRELRDVWLPTCWIALQLAAASSRAGDARAPPPHLARVADVALLYTDIEHFQLVDNESEQRYPEAEALSVLWQLVQRHRLEDGGAAAASWATATGEYCAGERRASQILLRRRWYEFKLQARGRLLAYWHTSARQRASLEPPTTLHRAIVTRYPHIVTSPMPSWSELVAGGHVGHLTLREEDFAELSVGLPPTLQSQVTSQPPAPKTMTSQVPHTVTPQRAPAPVTSQSPASTPVTSQSPASTPVTSHNTPAPGAHSSLDEDKTPKHIKPDPEDQGTPAVKCDRVIKSEVVDDEYNVPYGNGNNAQNDTDKKSEVVVDIKKEPRETMSSRIVFADDDDYVDHGDVTSKLGDDATSEPECDDDFRNCEFDNKLLASPRVELTRLDDELKKERGSETEDMGCASGASRIVFEDDAEIDTHGNSGNSKPVRVSEHRVQSNRGRGKTKKRRRSKAQKLLSTGGPDDAGYNVTAPLHHTEADTSSQGSSAGEMPTLSQLNHLLATLTSVSSAQSVLHQSRQYCCAARKHRDVSDQRRRMGIATHPHVEGGAAACRCSCGDLLRRAADLRRALLDLTQGRSIRNNDSLVCKCSRDKRETSPTYTYNPTLLPRPLRVASSATRRPVQSSKVTHNLNKAKDNASVLECREAVTPVKVAVMPGTVAEKPVKVAVTPVKVAVTPVKVAVTPVKVAVAPVKVATVEHTTHDREDGALTPPLPTSRSDIPVQVELIYDHALQFPMLVQTTIPFRVEIIDDEIAHVLRTNNNVPLQVQLICNMIIVQNVQVVEDIVAHVARVFNKTLVQVAIRRNKEQMQNNTLYVELECNIKYVHSAFIHKDIYVDMACDKISSLGQSESASSDGHRCYKIFVRGPLLQNELLVYKTEREEIEEQNIKQYHSKSPTIILDSFCSKTNRFDQFLTYPAYEVGGEYIEENNERHQSNNSEILRTSTSVLAPQNKREANELTRPENEADIKYENDEVIGLDSISETTTVILEHDQEIDETNSTSIATAHNDNKQKPSESNSASQPAEMSDKDKIKLFASKHECQYMRRAMDRLMESENLPPITLHEEPIPTLFVGEYPKKSSQKVQTLKSVVHKPRPNARSRRDNIQTQKIKPKAYSDNRHNSSYDNSEIISHKSIEVYDTERTVDHAPGKKKLSVSFRNNKVTHNELMLVQKLKEKFKEQPHKHQNKPEACASPKKYSQSPIVTSHVQPDGAHPSTSNNSAAQNPERNNSTEKEASIPARCVSPKQKSDAASVKSDPVPCVPSDEDSGSFKHATLVRQQSSDGIRKGLMFVVPSSLRGKNEIIHVPETASHTKLSPTESLNRLDAVLDPIKLIPLSSTPDELSLDTSTKTEPSLSAKLPNSDKQLHEVPVISGTDLVDTVASTSHASDDSKNMNPPPILTKSLITRRHSHHYFEMNAKETSLKDKIKAEWLKNYVDPRQKRRLSVPNCSYPARPNMSDKPDYTHQPCKIAERQQCKLQIKLPPLENDTKTEALLVSRDTITAVKPVLPKTNAQGGLATLLQQLAKVSPKVVSPKTEPNANTLKNTTSPTSRPTCRVRITLTTGPNDNAIEILNKSDLTTNATTGYNTTITDSTNLPPPPLQSSPSLPTPVASEQQHNLVQQIKPPLCVSIPQQDDLQVQVSENDQLCSTSSIGQHLLMLKSIPERILDVSPSHSERQNISKLNIEQIDQKKSGEPELITGNLKHMSSFVLTPKNKNNNAALKPTSLTPIEKVTNDENLNKIKDQTITSAEVNSEVCILEDQIIETANTSVSNDMPVLSEVESFAEDDGIAEGGAIKTELRQPILAIVMSLDATGPVEFVDLNDDDDLAWHKDLKMVIENQTNVSFEGIGNFSSEPTEPSPTTSWDSKNSEIPVQDIPLPSDDKEESDASHGTVATGSENASSLCHLQDVINTEQKLPTIFIFKEEAPTVAASSLSSDIIILRFDKCQIPLSMCHEYLVLTDAKIPCYGPSYYTLAPYEDVVQVDMDFIDPANTICASNNVEKQKSNDVTVNKNNISTSVRNNVREDNVAKEDKDNNEISDNKDTMTGNNIILTSNNKDDKSENNRESGFNHENKAMASVVDTKRQPNKILSVVCSVSSLRGLARGGGGLWVLATTPGRCGVLERARCPPRLALYGDLDTRFLMDLASQLNATAAQSTSSKLPLD